ncbi:MAG: hypothetical protein ACFCVC_11700 [Acidimicrobiia bacterium]
MSEEALPVHERPFTGDRFHTAQLPDTPTRSFRIPATGWIEAPDALIHLGDELDEPVEYKRRIGRYLLWRAGPPVGDALYLALDRADTSRIFQFRLMGRTGEGIGPDATVHQRFRTWKESLLADSGETTP